MIPSVLVRFNEWGKPIRSNGFFSFPYLWITLFVRSWNSLCFIIIFQYKMSCRKGGYLLLVNLSRWNWRQNVMMNQWHKYWKPINASRYFRLSKRLVGVKLKLRIPLTTSKKNVKTARIPVRLLTDTTSCNNRKKVIELIMNLIDLIHLHLFKLPHYSLLFNWE